MRFFHWVLGGPVLACLFFTLSATAQPQQDSKVSAGEATDDAVISEAVAKAKPLVIAAKKSRKAGEYEKARELLSQALSILDRVPGCRQSREAMSLASIIGHEAYEAVDLDVARRAWSQALAYHEKNYTSNDQTIWDLRLNLAVIDYLEHRYEEAKPAFERIVAHLDNKGATDTSFYLMAKENHALTLHKLGHHREAKKTLEDIIEMLRTKSPDPSKDIPLQRLQLNLADVLLKLGENARAMKLLEEALTVFQANLAPHHPNIQNARTSFADTLTKLGYAYQALPLIEQALAVYEKILAKDNPRLHWTRLQLASILCELGQATEALKKYEAEIKCARELFSEDDPILLWARQGLALSLLESGDSEGSRLIYHELIKDMEGRKAELSDLYQIVLTNLGAALYDLEEYESANVIFEKLEASLESTSDPDDLDLQGARNNLAATLWKLGKLERAKTLCEEVLAVYERKLPPDHPKRMWTEINLAGIQGELGGDPVAALQSMLEVHQHLVNILPPGHPYRIAVQGNLANACRIVGRVMEAAKWLRSALNEAKEHITRVIHTCGAGGIDRSVTRCQWVLDRCLSLAGEDGFKDPEVFVASETFRAAGARACMVQKAVADTEDEQIKRLQEGILLASMKIATAREQGDAFFEIWKEKESAERRLAERVAELPGMKALATVPTPEEIASCLPEGSAAVIYVYYLHQAQKADSNELLDEEPRYLAFVLDSSGAVSRIELDSAKIIDEAVKKWRDLIRRPPAVGTGKELLDAGREVARLLFDPLHEKLGEARHIVVSPDSVLATIPFEALPINDRVVADDYTLSYIDSLSSLTLISPTAPVEDLGLLTFGGIDYNNPPKRYLQGEDKKETADSGADFSLPDHATLSSPPRSTRIVERALPLQYAGTEAECVKRVYRGISDAEALFLDKSWASKASLINLAPRARYLHIVTHGYFAPDNINSDLDELQRRSGEFFFPLEERIISLAPSVLCGLKLAGYNQSKIGPSDPGTITAEEIQALDLRGCELVVLSACESNLGLFRAGQGIMSMQRAFFIAGAKGSVTSLWSVNDQATWLFFSRFYRHLWEECLPPQEALRRARLWLKDLTWGEIEEWSIDALSDDERGFSYPSKMRQPSSSAKPFASPYYWAPFVYWGKVK